MVGKASQFKDVMREGFMEEMEALKGENQRHASDVADRVTDTLVQGLQGFENQLIQMHHEYGEGKHFYQIETKKLDRAELERVKHELSLARSEIDRLRRAGREENRDHLEALREIVQE